MKRPARPRPRSRISLYPLYQVAGLCTLLGGCANTGPLPFLPPSAGVSAEAPAVTRPTQAGGAVMVGSKEVQLVGLETDTTCSRVVAPFELSDNLGELSKLAATLATEHAGKVFSDKALAFVASATGGAAPAPQAPKAAGLAPEIRLAAKRMNWLPMQVERMYGQTLLDQMKSGGRLLPREGRVGTRLYPKADALLAQVLAGVQEPYTYQFEIHVSTEPGQNAMALPGGFVVVDKALLEKPELADKALFAVGHEIAHVLQRHQTRALQARVIDALALKDSLPEMIRSMQSAYKEPAAILNLLVGGKLLFERHSEQQELQADACSMRVLDKGLGSDARLLAAVQGFAKSLPKPAPAESTAAAAAASAANGLEALQALAEFATRPVDAHPSTVERIANLNAMLVELRKRPGLAHPAPGVQRAAAVRRPALPTAAVLNRSN